MSKFFKKIANKLSKKWNIIKTKVINLPKILKVRTINFFVGTYEGVKEMPKYSKYVAKNTYVKIINIPMDIKSWAKKIKGYRFNDYKKIFLNNAILISLLGVIVYIITQNNRFFGWIPASSILTQASTKLIIALGTGTIIVARGTDLSAGRAVGLTALIAATFSQDIAYKSAFIRSVLGYNSIIIIIVTILIGAILGLINGFIIAKLNVTPFIATLGMMLVIFGLNIFLATKISNSQPIGTFADQYTKIVRNGFYIGKFKISWLATISIFIAFIMWIIWTKLPFGRKLFAVGGNPKAAAVSGISVVSILLITYVVGGILYGIAGTLEAWRIGSVTSTTGTMYELDAIAACIVGGLSFDGGRGKISGIILGVLIFQTITYGFSFIGVSTAMTYIFKGLIIVVAVAMDMIKHRVKI